MTDFFTFAASNATNIDTLRALSDMQANGPNPMPPAGLRAYLERLQKEGLWIDAYITWLNSLRQDQLNAIGNLFNGDFETEISNRGFDWIITPASQAIVETAPTHGASGNKALRVLFRGPRIQFQNLRNTPHARPGKLPFPRTRATATAGSNRRRPVVDLLPWPNNATGQQRDLHRHRSLEAFLGTRRNSEG